MTQDDIVEMAKPFLWGGNVVEGWTFSSYEQLETFAKLVAKHTLMNIDPSKFISWQEGFEAGRFAEREACAKIGDGFHDDEANCGDLLKSKSKNTRNKNANK